MKPSNLFAVCIIAIGVVWILAFSDILKPRPTEKADNYRIAIARYFSSQPSLDRYVKSLKQELAAEGFIDGKNVTYIEKSVSEQPTLIPNMVADIVAQDPDLVISVTTGVSSAFVDKLNVPLVFGAVTDPVGAGIVDSLNEPRYNITGTSDAWAYREQLLLVNEIDKNIKKLGVVFDPGNAASQYGMKQIRQYAKELDFEIEEVGVSSLGEMNLALSTLTPNVDALFLSSDTTVISGIASATNAAINNKIPLFVGDDGTVSKGGMAGVSVGYAELGKQAGNIVARALRGERNIPVFVGIGTDVHINLKSAELMNVDIPTKTLNRAKQIYKEISK